MGGLEERPGRVDGWKFAYWKYGPSLGKLFVTGPADSVSKFKDISRWLPTIHKIVEIGQRGEAVHTDL
jgi:hypothetical protein